LLHIHLITAPFRRLFSRFTAFGIRRNAATWTGMNHMNGRVQEAVSGRFLSQDPGIPHPGNTQSYN
jgi:hypothetical protein